MLGQAPHGLGSLHALGQASRGSLEQFLKT